MREFQPFSQKKTFALFLSRFYNARRTRLIGIKFEKLQANLQIERFQIFDMSLSFSGLVS
jgi:hypothetical protein